VRRFLVPPKPERLESGPAPTFSVVVPAYQAAATVAEAVDSALSQSLPPLEVIVVDDGSTDGTHDVLAPYCDRIVYVRQENGGGASAVNTGLRLAVGEFMAILDADDVYLPERVEALTELGASRPDLDILGTDAIIEVDGRFARLYSEGAPFPIADQRTAILRGCFLAAPSLRVTRLRAAGGLDESFATAYDWECWLRLVLGGARAGLVDEPLYLYRYQEGSLTARRVTDLRGRVRLLERAVIRGDLRAHERVVLESELAWRRREALLAEAEEALLAGAADARRRARAVLGADGMTLETRAKAAAATLAPAVARRLLGGRSAAESRRLARPAPHAVREDGSP
jgi:glycosyltransferase involved in cell wall biosynthesis